MEVAVTMPSTRTILERLRWKVGLGLVIVAAGFAANAAPAAHTGSDVARSSWGFSRSVETGAEAVDVARSSWGFSRSSESDVQVVDVARSSWGFARSADAAVDAGVAVDAA
ncbi:MAG: hypothetical protein ABI611_03260 [Solirubrobacteraceae bacterium]